MDALFIGFQSRFLVRLSGHSCSVSASSCGLRGLLRAGFSRLTGSSFFFLLVNRHGADPFLGHSSYRNRYATGRLHVRHAFACVTFVDGRRLTVEKVCRKDPSDGSSSLLRFKIRLRFGCRKGTSCCVDHPVELAGDISLVNVGGRDLSVGVPKISLLMKYECYLLLCYWYHGSFWSLLCCWLRCSSRYLSMEFYGDAHMFCVPFQQLLLALTLTSSEEHRSRE